MAKKLSIGAAAVILTVLSPALAAAHPMAGVGDFYAGVLHPLTAIESVLPMVALSLLAGQQGRDTAIAILVTFPLTLMLGAAAALVVPLPHAVGWVNIAFMAALGLLVAAARPMPLPLSAGLSAFLGVTIGWANGVEITAQISPFRFIPGLALAGLLLVTYGIGCVRRLQAPWMRVGFRVLGSWIAAVGILVLGLK